MEKLVPWLKKLFVKTRKVAGMYTRIFLVVMFLNQLLFFGLCLNPVCLVAAMPHVLFITLIIGTWLYKPNIRKLKKTLRYVPESFDKVKEHIEQHGKNISSGLFTGNVYLFVTQNKSKGEDDFLTVLSRYEKPQIASIVRLDNRYRSKALLRAIESSKHLFETGDIVAIVRGGGDTDDPQFDSYKDNETCNEVRYLRDHNGVITVTGIGHSTDRFQIEKAVSFAQITPTDAAMQVAFLVNGGKW